MCSGHSKGHDGARQTPTWVLKLFANLQTVDLNAGSQGRDDVLADRAGAASQETQHRGRCVWLGHVGGVLRLGTPFGELLHQRRVTHLAQHRTLARVGASHLFGSAGIDHSHLLGRKRPFVIIYSTIQLPTRGNKAINNPTQSITHNGGWGGPTNSPDLSEHRPMLRFLQSPSPSTSTQSPVIANPREEPCHTSVQLMIMRAYNQWGRAEQKYKKGAAFCCDETNLPVERRWGACVYVLETRHRDAHGRIHVVLGGGTCTMMAAQR